MAGNILGGLGLGGVGDIVAFLGVGGLDEFKKALDDAGNKSKDLNKVLNISMAAGAAAFAAVTSAAASYQSKMADIKTQMADNPAGFDKLSKDILELSTQIPLATGGLADLAYEVTSTTVPAANYLQVLGASAKAAVGGTAEAADVFKLFSAVIRGYGMDWGEVDRISDITFQTVKLGQTLFSELATSMQGAIPIAAEMGVSFEEIAGAAATLTGVTGNTSEVMTQFESVMTAMIKPTEQMEKAFAKLGVTSGKELIDKMGGLGGALNALKDYTGKYNISIGDLLGRKEGMLAYFALTGKQAEEFAEKTKIMYTAVGTANEAFEIQMATLKNQAIIFKNTIFAAFIESGQAPVAALQSMLTTINKYPGTIKTTVSALTTFTIGIGGLAGAIKGLEAVNKVFAILQGATGPWGIAIVAVVTAVTALNAAMKAKQEAALRDISTMSDQIETLKKAEGRYNTLKESTNKNETQSQNLSTAIKDLKDRYALLGIDIDETNEKFGKQYEIQAELMKIKLQEKIAELKEKTQELNEVQTTGITIMGAIPGKMGEIVAGVYGLTKGLGDKNNLNEQLAAAEFEMKELTAATDPVNLALKTLDSYGIQTTATLKEQEKQVRAAIEVYKNDSIVTQALNIKLAELNEKLRGGSNEIKTNAGRHSELIDINKKLNLGLQDSDGILTDFNTLVRMNTERWAGNLGIVKELTDVYPEFVSKEKLLADALEITTDKQFDHLDAMEKAAKQYDLTPEQLKIVEEALKKLREETGKGEIKWTDLVQVFDTMIGKIPGVSTQFKNITSNVITMITSGFDPATVALGAFSIAQELFGKGGEKIIITVQDVIKEFGDYGEQIEKTKEIINSFSSDFDSGILKSLEKQRDALLEQIASVKTLIEQHKNIGNSSDMFKGALEQLQAQLKSVTEQLDKYAAAFADLTNIDTVTDSLNYLSDAALEVFETFGKSYNYEAIKALLLEQIRAANDALAGMEAGTDAFNELFNSAQLAAAAIAVINGEFASIEDYLNAFGIIIPGINDALETLSGTGGPGDESKYGTPALEDYKEELEDTIPVIEEFSFSLNDKLWQAAKKAQEALKDVNKETVDLKAVMWEAWGKADELFAPFTDKVNEIKKVFDNFEFFGWDSKQLESMFYPMLESLMAFRDGLKEGSPAWLEAEKQISALIDQFNRLAGTESEVDDFSEAIAALNKQLEDTQTEFDAVKKSLDEKIALRVEIDKKIENITSEINKLVEDVNTRTAEYDKIKFEIDSEIQGKQDTIDALNSLMSEMGSITNERGKLFAFMEKGGLDYFNDRLEEITGKVRLFAAAWGEMADKTIKKNDVFKKNMEAALSTIEQLQYFKIDLDTTQADESIEALIFQMRDYLKTLNPDSQAYLDAKKQLDELTEKYYQLDPAVSAAIKKLADLQGVYDSLQKTIDDKIQMKVEIDAKIEDLIKQRTDLITQLNERTANFEKIKLQLDTEISGKEVALQSLQDLMIEINGTMANNPEGLSLDYINDKLAEITGKTQLLAISWGEMYDKMFEKNDSFNSNMKTAMAALEKILYFKLDLNTTDADEQINASIFQMESYLATLNPESQAYKDALAALNELKKKFAEAGGELSKEKAAEYTTEQAQAEADALAKTIEDLKKQLEDEKIKFDADIAPILEKIGLIDAEIQKLNADKIQIDIDISEAQKQMEALAPTIAALMLEIQKMKDGMLNAEDAAEFAKNEAQAEVDALLKEIQNLQDKLDAEKLKLDADIEPALEKIAALKLDLTDLENQRIEVDLDIINAQAKLDELMLKIQTILDNLKKIENPTTPPTPGNGPETFHSGGMLNANETLIKGLKDEFILRPAISNRFGEDKLSRFNQTGNIEHLGNVQQQPIVNVTSKPNVVVHNANPDTWVEITDNNIYPRIQKKQRYYESAAEPYRV